MIVEELHYNIKRKWDELSNNVYREPTDIEIDKVINTAIFYYVEMFLNGNNKKGFDIGFEVDRQMLDMLDTLVFSYPEQPKITPENLLKEKDFYIANFDLKTKSEKEFKSYISGRVFLKDCDNCNNITVHQHGDKNKILSDSNSKPDSRFNHSVGFLRNDILYVYSDKEIDNLEYTYIKEPNKVCLGTYTNIPTTSNPSPGLKLKVECDLPEQYHELLVTMAVQELASIFQENNKILINNNNKNEIK